MHPQSLVAGVLLAGGRSSRMGGGDKCLRILAGESVLDHVIRRVRPQVKALLLSANDDPRRFLAYGLPVIGDVVPGFAGPLAGVCTGLEWARREHPDCAWVASFATDTPFLPADLVARLLEATLAQEADMACAASGGRTHPVFGLWPVHLAGDLRRALEVDGVRRVDAWTARYRRAVVEFPADAVDPFFNANTPDDLDEAERLIARAGPGRRD